MYISNSVTSYPAASDFISDIRWLIQLEMCCLENHNFFIKAKLNKCVKPNQHPYFLVKYLHFLNLKVVDRVLGCSYHGDIQCAGARWPISIEPEVSIIRKTQTILQEGILGNFDSTLRPCPCLSLL